MVLEQLTIHSFDVAGIQLNSFEDVTIRDCEVHNAGHVVPVSGRYLLARVAAPSRAATRRLPRWPSWRRSWWNGWTWVYEHVVNGKAFAADDAQWVCARSLFVNPNENGHADGGVQYRLPLNSRGGAVMGFGNAPSQSRKQMQVAAG